MSAEGVKLTKAQASLVKLVTRFDMRFISLREARRAGLAEDFSRCRRAGLIRSAEYETTVVAEDFLNSPAGLAALTGSSS